MVESRTVLLALYMVSFLTTIIRQSKLETTHILIITGLYDKLCDSDFGVRIFAQSLARLSDANDIR